MTIAGIYSEFEPATETIQPLGATFFDFEIGRIATLLARPISDVLPPAKGVRFHFNRPRPENPTTLYAAACGSSRDILDSDLEAKDDYFKPDGSAVSKSRLPDIVTSTISPKANTCVFFSQAVLKEYIQNPQVTGLRLYVVGFGPRLPNVTPNLSLVAVGINSLGQPIGRFLLSEEPCPPNCPMGYP